MKKWEFKNEVGSDTAELLLYGAIQDEESWLSSGVGAKELAETLQSLQGKPLTVRINSYGGSVFAGHAIMSALKNYSGKVTAKIDGIAASAATVALMGADRIVMPANAMMMIHNPLLSLSGSYERKDFEQMSEVLEEVKSSILQAYRTRSHLSEEKLSKLMDQETWMTAATAKACGFVDEIEGKTSLSATNVGVLSNGLSFSKDQLPAGAQLINQIQGREEIKGMEKETIFTMADVKNFLQGIFPNSLSSPVAENLKEGGEEIMDMQIQNLTEEQLRNQCPALVDSIVNEAVLAERERIFALDELAASLPAELLNEAKYKTPKTANEVAVEALKNSQNAGPSLLAYLKSGTENSGSGKVDVVGQESTEDEKRSALVENMVRLGGGK